MLGVPQAGFYHKQKPKFYSLLSTFQPLAFIYLIIPISINISFSFSKKAMVNAVEVLLHIFYCNSIRFKTVLATKIIGAFHFQ